MRRIVSLLVVMTVAACTTSGDPPSTASSTVEASTTTASTRPPTTTTLRVIDAASGFAECMRAEGIDVPEIPLDAQGRPMLDEVVEAIDTTSVEVRGALATCASILTSSGALDLSADPGIQALIVDQLEQFADCMRSEGLDGFPDPDPDFDGTGSPFPLEQIPFNDQAFPDASLACQEILGSFGLEG